MTISDIFVYPIKSMRGTAVEEASVCGYGLEHDRRWMLVDANSKMITQRECPRLATLYPHVENSCLRIALPDGGEIAVPFGGEAWTEQQVTVDVWGHGYVGVVASDAINAALSEGIGASCRLALIRSDIFRMKHEVAFHDDSPLLVISQASLEELNRRSPGDRGGNTVWRRSLAARCDRRYPAARRKTVRTMRDSDRRPG